MHRSFAYLGDPILEMNITDLCNLRCDFCPRAHGYPNNNVHMSMDMLDTILDSRYDFYRRQNKYVPIYAIGRGEPTLHENWTEIVQKVAEHNKKYYGLDYGIDEIHTNGYKWESWIPEYGHLIHKVHFNCYYNRNFVEYLKIKEHFSGTNVWVYDRGTTGNNEGKTDQRVDGLGVVHKVRYNNRAGSIPQDVIPLTDVTETKNEICMKPWQTLYIDFDGEWRICCNDWTDLVSLGNIKDFGMYDHIWKNPKYIEYRWRLINGDRKLTPCNKCNAVPHPDFIENYKEAIKLLKSWDPAWLREVKETLPYNEKF